MHAIRFQNRDLILIRDHEGRLSLPDTTLVSHMATIGELFVIDGGGADVAMLAPETTLPDGFEAHNLRQACTEIADRDYALAIKGAELTQWDSTSKHCSVCGGIMERASEISKKCEHCGREEFPHISPCVMVLIKRGEEALLVHARTFSRPFYGLVAGFVETGENLEECIHREVMEETSLRVKNIKYYGSQTWPYPGQLMIGFTAEYDSGELKFADGELSEGGFFSREDHPAIPTPPSLAHIMINAWLKGEI